MMVAHVFAKKHKYRRPSNRIVFFSFLLGKNICKIDAEKK